MKIGIVGWGEIAKEHASHFAAGGAELGAVVSRQENLNLDVPIFETLEEMLPHVDAVTIARTNQWHARLCLEAIAAHKPVLVEKPLCISRAELVELEVAFQRLEVPVHLGYRLRWNPTILTLKKRLKNLRRIKCVYRMGINQLAEGKDWTRKSAITGGSFSRWVFIRSILCDGSGMRGRLH